MSSVETPEAALREELITTARQGGVHPDHAGLMLRAAHALELAALAAPSVSAVAANGTVGPCEKCGHAFSKCPSCLTPLAAPSVAPPQPVEGLSVICGLCGTLVAGEEAGDRVRWVHCRECRLSAPPAQSTEPDALYDAWRDTLPFGRMIAPREAFKAGIRAAAPSQSQPETRIPEIVEAVRAELGDFWDLLDQHDVVSAVLRHAAAPSHRQPAEEAFDVHDLVGGEKPAPDPYAYSDRCICGADFGEHSGVTYNCPSEGDGFDRSHTFQPAAPQPETREQVPGFGWPDSLEIKGPFVPGGRASAPEGESEERERIGQVLVGYLTHTLGYDAAIDRILALRAAPSPGGERET